MYLTAQQAKDLCEQHGSIRKAARSVGIPESTMRKRIRSDRPMRIPDSVTKIQDMNNEIDDLKRRLAFFSSNKPKYIGGRTDNSTKIIAIGDTHDQPGMDKDRFKWIARHCAAVIPHRIVQIGDFCSWDSVSTHDAPGSVSHAARPSFKADMESCEEAMCLFYKEIKDLNIPLELTAGNHEDRIQRFENKNAETVGTLYMQFEELCARYRWRLHPYGQWLFIDGVGFTHVPKNIMGKPNKPCLGMEAVEHRDILKAQLRQLFISLVVAKGLKAGAAHKPSDLACDKARFLPLIKQLAQFNTGAVRFHGHKFFVDALPVFLNDLLAGRNNGAGGAKVLFEFDNRCIREVLLKI